MEQMNLNGYYREDSLIELFQEGRITRCQLICHHSPERRQQFVDFCKERNLQQDEHAAELFSEELLKIETEL
jgi:hypothetical protein